MIDFVVDVSAVIEVIVRDHPDRALRRRLLTGSGAAPEILDLEAASVIRTMARRNELTASEGRDRLRDIRDTPVARSPHRPLLDRVWELRNSIAAYDAAYVALAELFAVPLLTCDARLGRTHGHHADVELYPRS